MSFRKILLVAVILALAAAAVYADLTATEGLAIDLSSAGAGTDFTVAFDPTELTGGTIFDDGGEASVTWSWNLSAGDPSIAFGNAAISFLAATSHLGADNVIGSLELHDLGTIKFWDDGDDTSVIFGPIADGTTTLGVTGTISATGLQVGGTAVAVSGGAFHNGFSDYVANEHIDWTGDQGATNIHSGNIPDLSGTYEPAGITASDISDKNAGTDITADLEEEGHASEHAVGAADTVFPADPGADRYLMWDDDPGAVVWAEVAAGYTNLTSFIGQTAWRLFYSNADGDVTELALGSDGEYLKSNGAALAPSWATPSGAAHNAVTLAADADVLLALSTQEVGLDTQTANYVFAGPTSGAAADPTFRALVADDIPDLSGTYLTAESDPAVGTHESTYDHTLIATALQSETDPTALLTAGTDNVKDTHIDWGSGAGQVNADDLGDGATNAIPTLTQESHWDTAYGWGDHAGAGYLTAEVDGSTTNEIEVVDEAFSAANFNGHTTAAVSQDDFYDLWHGIDTDDDGDIDAIDATVWATKQAADADLDDLADGSLSASKVAGVADADYGDVTVSGGVWAVEDDSHSHSGYQATVTEGSLANSVILSEDIKDGEVAVADLAAAAKTACVNFVIDGGGSAIATGIKGDFVIPFACTITGIAVLGDQSGSIVIDLWQGTIAEQIAGTIVDADSITASDPPTVSSAIGVDDDTLTDWDATVNALQVIRVNVDSCTTMTRCTLVLKLSKT